MEIGNPTYKMYEGGEPDDVGGLLDADFALDPDKVCWRPSKGLPEQGPTAGDDQANQRCAQRWELWYSNHRNLFFSFP